MKIKKKKERKHLMDSCVHVVVFGPITSPAQPPARRKERRKKPRGTRLQSVLFFSFSLSSLSLVRRRPPPVSAWRAPGCHRPRRTRSTSLRLRSSARTLVAGRRLGAARSIQPSAGAFGGRGSGGRAGERREGATAAASPPAVAPGKAKESFYNGMQQWSNHLSGHARSPEGSIFEGTMDGGAYFTSIINGDIDAVGLSDISQA